MSTALTKAIYARMAGTEIPALTGEALAAQVALAGLLAVDPDPPSGPAVFFGNMQRRAADNALLFPCVTLRPDGGPQDYRFGSFIMADPFYPLEIWDNSPSPIKLLDISGRLELLFDSRRGAPALPLASGGKVIWMELQAGPSVHYDDKINAWLLLSLWRFKEARFTAGA